MLDNIKPYFETATIKPLRESVMCSRIEEKKTAHWEYRQAKDKVKEAAPGKAVSGQRVIQVLDMPEYIRYEGISVAIF